VFSYQSLFVLPAFFAALALQLPKGPVLNKIRFIVFKLWKQLLFLFVVVVGLVGYFLIRKVERGINWNAGPSNEFLFDLSKADFNYSIQFLINNIKWIILSTLTPIPYQWHTLGFITAIMIGGLILIGCVRIYKNPETKSLGLYFLIVGVIWMALVLMQKITLSPTRHSLFLVPMLLVILGFGLQQVVKWLRSEYWLGGLILFWEITFCISIPEYIKTRADVVPTEKIALLAEKYKVEALAGFESTHNFLLMPSQLPNLMISLDREDVFLLPPPFQPALPNPVNRILFMSTRSELNKIRPKLANLFMPVFNPLDTSTYRVLYQEQTTSTTEVEYYPLTQNGTNACYITIVEVR
jgi:hypothetical protein